VVDHTVDDLFDDLGVAGRVAVVDQVRLGLAVDDLLDAVAIAVVNKRDVRAVVAGALDQAVLAVVVVNAEDLLSGERRRLRDGSGLGVAVIVVLIAVEAVVPIVAEGLVGDARERPDAVSDMPLKLRTLPRKRSTLPENQSPRLSLARS